MFFSLGIILLSGLFAGGLCKDDKPKDAEIMLFQAGSDYPLSAKGTGMRPYLKQLSEEDRGEYIDDFVKRIKEIYSVQKNGSIILKYPRLFFTAKRV